MKDRKRSSRRFWIGAVISAAAIGGALYCLPVRDVWPSFRTLVRILLEVGVLSLVATVLEARGWLRKLGKLFSPLVRFARLPEPVASALTAAPVSSSIAGLILAEARNAGRVTRREMITGALLCAPVTVFGVSVTTALPTVAILGRAGVWYYLASYGVLAVMFAGVLAAARMSSGRIVEADFLAAGEPKQASLPEAFRLGLSRTGRFLVRVVLLTTPFLLWTTVAAEHGAFDFASRLPEGVRAFLPPAAWTVFAARFGGMLSAAGVAAELATQKLLTTAQLVLILLAGNVINGILRTIRRGVPVSLGIYPGTDGAWIAGLSMAIRVVLTLAAMGLTMAVIAYE